MKEKKEDESLDKEFTAYIIRGNRQVIEREVRASRRFKIGEDTYIIKSECIFLKKIGANLKSISVYKEGNPNPYSFEIAKSDTYVQPLIKKIDAETGKVTYIKSTKRLIAKKGELIPNLGLSNDELCKLYGGDMFNILIEGQHEDKWNYSFILIVANMILCISAFILTYMGVFMKGG